MTESTRSPIKDKPLRHAGQSLEEERRSLIEEKLEPYLMMGAMFVILAMLEWWRYYRNDKPHPIIFSLAALLAVALGMWRMFRLKPKFRALRQGIEGEKAVGQYLERLRADGYQVFHDIVASGFNIDHVLIGPAGVFTVETKTWSKPLKGDARITIDGDNLIAANQTPSRDPIVQAKSQAAWLKNLLRESTGRPLDVFPVILFPGWFIDQAAESRRDVWILEPKALPSFLSHAPRRNEASDMKLAAFHLSRFIRSAERERRF